MKVYTEPGLVLRCKAIALVLLTVLTGPAFSLHSVIKSYLGIGYKTWFLILTEEYKFGISEKNLKKIIFRLWRVENNIDAFN